MQVTKDVCVLKLEDFKIYQLLWLVRKGTKVCVQYSDRNDAVCVMYSNGSPELDFLPKWLKEIL